MDYAVMATTREEAMNAEVVATGKRWCSSCQSTKKIEGGVKTPRMWMCKACVEIRKQWRQAHGKAD